MAIAQELLNQIGALDAAQQKQVLDFVHTLNHTNSLPTIPGEALIAWANEANFDPDDLKDMMDAIDEWCERIDPDEPDLFT